jgi:phospholipase C
LVIDPLPAAEALAALRDRIDHIVVLMLENRSFDQILGHLSLDGRDEIDGLQEGMSNSYRDRRWEIHNLEKTWSLQRDDPSHSGDWVAVQINDGAMDGFVRSYLETRDDPAAAAAEPRSPVMGYFTAAQLPVYQYLAEHFCVCDHWFASVPGATWPNRLYAAAGESAGLKSNQTRWGLFDWPFYSLPSFVRHLDATPYSWRWYSAEALDVNPPTIQLIDHKYRFAHGTNFALFDDQEPITGQPSFLHDAASGQLANVCWIDPNFHSKILGLGARGTQNDDHPPADVSEGQRLVGRIVNALINGPKWEKTMLIVVYDEHGGMFDHVAPPACEDNRTDFRRLGVRVPAIVACPWIPERSVAKLVLDHTSIMRTALARFRADAVHQMGARVSAAQHLGTLLTLDEPRSTVPTAPDVPVTFEEGFEVAPSPEERAEMERQTEASLQTEALRSLPGERLIPEAPPPEQVVVNDLQFGLAAAAGELKSFRSG